MEPPERPADPAVRRAYLKRIVALFRPYRRRLSGVLALIIFSSALGVIPALLLREVIDDALPNGDTRLLGWLVAGMVAIAIVTGALGVVQTLLSNQVGQRVMHDLRTAVYKHLQRLSLAFFTRTRTGEVQSRLANDIGGVQEVVTSTATSIVSNVTVVLATVVAMFVLDWRLTLFALALLPLFVWMTKRVGDQRRKVAKVRQESMADISSLVQESLSVSGILLGKTMGRAGALAERFEGESGRLADLEVRSRMTGRWMMASIQTSFAIMPALVYLFAGHFAGAVSIGTVVAFTTLQSRLFFPVGSLLGVSLEVQTSLALFDRVFEYLDHPVDIEEGTRTLARATRRRGLRPCLVPLRGRGLDAAGRHVRGAGRDEDRARRRDRLGEDDRRLPRRAPLRRHRGRRDDRRRRRARAHVRTRSRMRSGSSPRRRTSSTPPFATTSASPIRTRPTRRSRRPHAPRRSTS